jgi:preprotein translocase subunit YajC
MNLLNFFTTCRVLADEIATDAIQAQPTHETVSTPQNAGLSSVSMLLFFLLIGGLFYVITVRPQRQRLRNFQKMLSNIRVGDEIVTIGGIIGAAARIDETTVLIETGAFPDKSNILVEKFSIHKVSKKGAKIEETVNSEKIIKTKDNEIKDAEIAEKSE